jgi:thiamine-monophosphate kinase
MTLPPEFTLIARHFRPLAGAGGLDLADDAALLAPPTDRELVLAADAMVAGVHFLADDPPETIGRKLLRVNLSDLAAMGAEPLAYLMTVALPHGTPDTWLQGFVAGLAEDQRRYALQVLGGDTVSTPGPLTLSLTILGSVPPGAAIRRSGAQPGDDLWVSGTLGDGALGLCAIRGEIPDDGTLAARYRLPEPRLALGQALRGLATAMLDVSDGLVQDCGHLARLAGCAAAIEAAALPLSPMARAAGDAARAAALSGGDDYELLFAAHPADAPRVEAAARAADTPVTRIGRFASPGEAETFTTGPAPVMVRDEGGRDITPARGGWSHT